MLVTKDGKVVGTFDGFYLTARTPEVAALVQMLDERGVPFTEENDEAPGLGLLRYLPAGDPRFGGAVRRWLRDLGYGV
jgi:hypothetical protein